MGKKKVSINLKEFKLYKLFSDHKGTKVQINNVIISRKILRYLEINHILQNKTQIRIGN